MSLLKQVNEDVNDSDQPAFKVEFNEHARMWAAFDENTYDHENDEGYVGWGENQYEAVDKLVNKLESTGTYTTTALHRELEDFHANAQAEVESERRLGIQDERDRRD